MTTVPDTEIHRRPLVSSKPASLRNSPFLYGLGSFGLESAYKVFWGFYVFYYLDVLGLAVTLAAIINVVYAIWDAVNDPLVGYLADNTRTRWGRRRPWLIVGLPFLALSLVLVYAVPEPFRQPQALFWYALAIVFLYEAASTVMNTNYQALFPELFQTFRDRTRASAANHGLGMAVELLGFSLTPIIYTRFGFVGMAVFFAALVGILIGVSVLRNNEDPSAQEQPPLELKTTLGEVLRDRPFWQFTVVVTLRTEYVRSLVHHRHLYNGHPLLRQIHLSCWPSSAGPPRGQSTSDLGPALWSPSPWSRCGAGWSAGGA